MADFCRPVVSEIVTKFLMDTCTLFKCFNSDAFQALNLSAELATLGETDYIPITTGSVAEFYVQPMVSSVGDIDIMYHRSDELVIPTGVAPPTELPDEFHSRVKVYEIEDSEFPGYVYVESSYLLTECTEDGKYKAEECERWYLAHRFADDAHGPAVMHTLKQYLPPLLCIRIAGWDEHTDEVYCMRCLSWPPQAADWPTRHRNYGWPDSATVDRVVSNGCDLVNVAHRQCRRDKWERDLQRRLSFSRAEVVLLNSWNEVQQILYHLLRVFVKMERLTDSANNSDAATLSNYHIKTLMLWACEQKPRNWWTDNLNLVRLCMELLHILADWLTDARCPHYFIHNCNLFDHPDNWYCSPLQIASRLASETEVSLTEWFINKYLWRIRESEQLCPEHVSRLFDEASTSNMTRLQEAISAVVDWRLEQSLRFSAVELTAAQFSITLFVSLYRLTVRLCLCWIRGLTNIDHRLCVYFTAIVFLHVACRSAGNPLTDDELLDILSTTCLQSNEARRCRNARHSSVLSLSLAAKLMKVVANNSRSTVQLIEIELSKAYLYRALRCKDSDSDLIYCLANVYLAVLYYTTGQYQTAIDHCTLVTRSQDHSQCSSHVVEGELLPKIDDEIDTVLGLAVFYQYLRTAALNEQQAPHVSVFTTELFAHFLHIRCLTETTECRQLTKTDEVQRYQKSFYEMQQMFSSDLLLINFAIRTKYQTHDRTHMADSGQTMPGISHDLDSSEFVELLQQSAVEHLTKYRQLEAQEIGSDIGIVTTDFEALYAYKRGEYQRCLLLASDNVRELIDDEAISCVLAYPVFIQLMDDDIVSLIGVMMLTNHSRKIDSLYDSVYQLPLSLYLMTQCQIQLHQSVTSLSETLEYAEAARQDLDENSSTLNYLLLAFIKQKILLYINRELV